MSTAGSTSRSTSRSTAGSTAGNTAGSTVTAGRGLLHQRDFRLVWIGQTTSRLGSTISSVALPLVAVSALDASPLLVGVLAAASWLPWLLVGLPAGAWVDRLPRRPVMLTCDVVSSVLLLSVPVAAWCGVMTLAHLLTVAFLTGVASVFFQTAYQAYLPGLLAREDLAEGNAKLLGTDSLATVAGPGVAGLITQASAAVMGLLADAVSFLVSAACLIGIRGRESGGERREAGPRGIAGLRREIGEGLRFVGRDPYLRVLTVAGAAGNLALTGQQTILVVFLIRVVHVAPGAVGYLVAAGTAGGVLGAFAATRLSRRFGTARALVLCQLCTAPFALLVPLAAQGWRLSLVVFGGSVVTAGVVAGNVIRGGFRQAYVPSHLLGRVVVSMQFLNFGAIPLGALAAGALGDALGAGATMWLTAGGVALAGLLLLIGPLHRRTDLPVRPEGRDG